MQNNYSAFGRPLVALFLKIYFPEFSFLSINGPFYWLSAAVRGEGFFA